MLFVRNVRRFAGAGSLAIVGLAVSATALIFVIHPAAAQSAFGAVQSAVTCAVTGSSACVSGTNTSSGIGVLGSSKTGLGVSGSATSNDGVKGASGSSYGVFGTSTSGPAGVAGTTANQSGVSGYTTASTGGVGVRGTSAGASGFGLLGRDLATKGTGVLGSVAKGTAVEADAGDGGTGLYAKVTGSATGVLVSAATGTGLVVTTAGMYGVHSTGGSYGLYSTGGLSGLYSTGGQYGVYSTGAFGVLGATTSGAVGVYGDGGPIGTGVEGSATGGDGVKGESSTGDGVYAKTYSGFGVEAEADADVAIVGRSPQSNGADIYGAFVGIIGRSNQSGAPLVATDQLGNTVFQVDGHGHVTSSGGYGALARIGNGVGVKSFGAQTSAPTIEDTGTAQLVGGAAAVRLDPTFARAIDKSAVYRVFLTPDGDTHGLYVATKSAAGFIVRESQGGRSSVAFDYRIIATAIGQSGQRMALVNSAATFVQAPLLTKTHQPSVKAAPLKAAPSAKPILPFNP